MPTTIKLRTSETQPFILLPAQVNGKGPFDFILDTGASMSILTEELANIVGIKGTEFKDALGAGGEKIKTPLGYADSLSIGETSVKDVRVGIVKEYPKCIGSYGGLGYNFLKEFILAIDYGNNLLTFTSPEEEQSDDSSLQTYIPLRIPRPDRPIILVDALINSQETFQFILDTGASQTVVSPQLAKQMSINDSAGDLLIGVGGGTQSSVGALDSLSVGDASLRNISVIVADIFSTLSQAVGAKFDGILGFNFLSKFKLRIDYPNGNLRFEEQPNAG